VLPIIRSHHERWDGTGYPDGLRGEEIPLLARILQIADVYDALTTARPYKPAHTPDEAFRILEDEARRGWRDIELLSLFREIREGFALADTGRGYLAWDESPVAQDLDKIRRQLTR
jgi:putative two-component system response regulator